MFQRVKRVKKKEKQKVCCEYFPLVFLKSKENLCLNFRALFHRDKVLEMTKKSWNNKKAKNGKCHTKKTTF